MWFATEDGLNKFNGTDFFAYRHNKSDSTSLLSNQVSCLFEDKEGRLWVGTSGGVLHLFNRKKNSFQRVKSEGLKRSGLLGTGIKSLCSDQSGNIWVATLGGLNIVDPKTFRVINFQSNSAVPAVIRQGTSLSLYQDRHHQIWVGSQQGLFRYDHQGRKFVPYLHHDGDPKSLAGNFVRAITEDNQGNLWIGTSTGLSMLTSDGVHFQNFRHEAGNASSLSNDIVYAVKPFDNETLWVGTENGLNVLNIRSGKINRYQPDGRCSYSLTNKSVRSILIDAQHIAWLGTYEGGINKYDPNLTFFSLKKSAPFDPYGLSAPFVTSFAETPSGDVFVGTDGGGLNLFHTNSGLFSRFTIRPGPSSSLSQLSILTLLMSRTQTLWIGTYRDGLYRFDIKTGAYKQYLQGAQVHSQAYDEIFCLLEDPSGKIWIGTNGAGVNIYNPTTNEFRPFTVQNGSSQIKALLSSAYLRALAEDSAGRIWLATYGAGLFCFDPASQKLTHYDKQHGDLPTNEINSLHSDRYGNLWVGTSGEGLVFFNPKLKKFRTYGENDGLANGVVRKVIEDSMGRVWVTTNVGVSWFDSETKKFTNYTYFNGLQNNTFVQGSGLLTRSGMLFFGGVEGFNFMSSKDLKTNKNVPDVLFTDLKVGGKTITTADSSILHEDISIAKTIYLDYKQNFSVSYVALNYTSPKQNQYGYRLKGFEKEWNLVGAKNTAYYTNLSPGTYDFEVMASNNDGVWNHKGRSIRIIVKPPFWMTWFAYLIYAVAAISALLLIRYRGVQKLKNEFQARQTTLETERILSTDRQKIKFLTNLSHEFRTPIALIMAPAEKLLNQSVDEQTGIQLQMIKRNSRRLLNLVNQLLDFRKLEQNELQLWLEDGEIISFIREACDSFRDLSETKKITCVFNSEIDHLYTRFDAEKIERVFFNLLSNAFKFTPEGGMISLHITMQPGLAATEGTLVIEVADTGVGIPLPDQEKIFERFYQSGADLSVINQGSGIGLSIVREFIQMHGGKISVKSVPEEGTVFTVELPVVHPSEHALPQNTDTDHEDVLLNNNEPDETSSVLEPINGWESDKLPLVLIVEDSEDFRYHLRESLSKYYRVIEAMNGKEGWQKALAGHPDLIVSDIMMPYMNGIELSLKIKADKRTNHIPVILLTASAGETEQLKGLTSGANDYLTKPFNFNILNTKIRNLLTYNLMLKKSFNKQVKVSPSEIKVQSVNEKFINTVVEYIEANLTNTQMSVGDISKHVGISRGSLYNKMLEITGMSPVEFIRTLKLEKAATLLEKSDMNIAEIAYLVGFTTPNYFAKTFKDHYKMLPSEYIHQKRKSRNSFVQDHDS